MIRSCICGSNSFSHTRDHDRSIINRSISLPPSLSSSQRANKDTKNPYSSRGLDKFTALLAEIEEKRQKIYSETNDPDNISLVRFVYSDNNDLKPIVVLKANRKSTGSPSTSNRIRRCNSGPHLGNFNLKIYPPTSASTVEQKSPRCDQLLAQEAKMKRCESKLEILKRPCCYWPAVMIMILLFLAVFGRSGAILCTSIGWYFVPTIADHHSLKRSSKKKDYHDRKLSDKKQSVQGHKGNVQRNSP